MEEKYFKLFNELSHDDIISFNIMPQEDETALPSKEMIELVEDFLDSHKFDENCFEKVFNNDIFFATAICSYLLQIGCSFEVKPSNRFKFLKPLFNLMVSLFNANQIGRKTFMKHMDLIVGNLFISRFGILFPTFDADYKTYMDEEKVRANVELGFKKLLQMENVDNKRLFKHLIDFYQEITITDFYMFYRKGTYFHSIIHSMNNVLFNKAYELLKLILNKIESMTAEIDEYKSLDWDDDHYNIDPYALKKEYIKVFSLITQFNKITDMIKIFIWNGVRQDILFEQIEFFIKANTFFDRIASDMSVMSSIYGFNEKYDLTYKANVKALKLYKKTTLSIKDNPKQSDKIIDFGGKDDIPERELKVNALAILKALIDSAYHSTLRGHITAKVIDYSGLSKDTHLVYIQDELDSIAKVDRLHTSLTSCYDKFMTRKFLFLNPILKEIALEIALRKKDYDHARQLAYSNFEFSPTTIYTLFIVRRHSRNAYLSIIDKLYEERKQNIVAKLKENDHFVKLYGEELCNELIELCSPKKS